MGLLGWSYPPGCSGPLDDYEGTCEVCGNKVDDCICPECPECGVCGDPECYEEHGMFRSHEQNESLKKNNDILEQIAKNEAEAEAALSKLEEGYE